ncbi:nitronate monooxygenase [Kocuria sp. M1R5S2]|uniref:nitronate monooxygenase n=1 Tax=Kocuria rhizosphaerae TaxID=3376285 RepID=UPI0037A0BD96
MFTLTDLSVPVVQAPMAGGPATVDLAAAVSAAGGLGFLAAGYKTADAMGAEVEELRSRTRSPFGVNVFVPEADVADPGDLAAYAAALAEVAAELDVPAPSVGGHSDDDYEAKIDLLERHPVPVVSFTFGLPDRRVLERLRAVGTAVVLSVSDDAEARRADALDPDAIVLQGPEAGAHRATLDMRHDPDQRSLDELLEATLPVVAAPVVAAGGIGTAARVERLLTAGAAAVQVGTLFLTAAETGTRPTHRRALLSGEFPGTVQTRAFSGRVARGLRNRFVEMVSGREVVGYPQVHYMTTPLRAAAARNDDPRYLNLWAGTAYGQCRETSAAEVVAALDPRRDGAHP